MKSSTMTFGGKTKRFLEPLKENKLFFSLSVLKFSIWAIYALVSVYVLKYAIASIESGDVLSLHMVIYYFVFFTGIYFIVSYIFRRVDWPYLYHDIERYIVKKYIPKIIGLDNNYLESIGTGRLSNIVSVGKKQWVESITSMTQQVTKIAITGGVMLAAILSTSFLFGITIIFILLLSQYLVVFFDSIAHKYRKIRTNEGSEYNRKMVRIIMSKNELVQNDGVNASLKDVLDSIDIISDANDYINRALFAVFNIVRIVSFIIRLFILFYIGRGVLLGEFTIAEFASALALVIVFESFLFDSTEFYKNFTKNFSDIEKLWETLDDAPQMKGYSTGLPFSSQNKDIIIDSITYGYNESKVFSDFSLTLSRGKKTALVGASGGGKTTLMKLIAGYLHPESGSISVLGNKLDETALKTYYPHIGYLTQEPGVFDATIRENLVSAITEGANKQKSIDEKLEKALRLAQCDFVFEMEKGLDTEIGERGVRLSGGQKQRLAIAKIFLKDPEIILLDEPTSALDSFSEEKITEALNILFEGRTVIIVAHRLQTVKRADDIIVIEGGEVVERGNHDELVVKGGIYNKMLELQSGF